MDVLAKWLWVSIIKTLAHPAMLPIALATFVSVTGPGGFAELGHQISGVPTVAVVPEPPASFSDESPPALLVTVVEQHAPAAAGPGIVVEIPPTVEVVTDESPGASEGSVAFEPPVDSSELPVTDTTPSGEDEPATPETPPQVPSDDETPDDGAGNDDGGVEAPGDDQTPPSDPPADGGDAGEENPDDGTTDGGEGDEPNCDPPGTGPEPHDGVPPGHDDNADGIDDRCQQDDASDQEPNAGEDGSGTGDGGDGAGQGPEGSGGTAGDQGTGGEPADDGNPTEDTPVEQPATGDRTPDAAECDPPGNGHENHGTPPPGHDKNEDGIDDRCQGVANGASGSQAADRKRNDDG